MATSEQIKIMCVKLGISVSELARCYGGKPTGVFTKNET